MVKVSDKNKPEHARHNNDKHKQTKQSSSDQKQTFNALLSITSAAVDALDKPRTPRRSDSVGVSLSSNVQSGPVSSFHPLSADVLTGVYAGLTPRDEATKSAGLASSPNTLENVSVGSRSSTASEILIRTTNTDPGVYHPSEPLNLSNASRLSNASKLSHSSKSSAANSTFLTGDAKRVKVSSKKLKEIKSPFEECSERTSVSAGNLGFFQMLDNSSLLNSPSRPGDKSSDAQSEVKTPEGERKRQPDRKKQPVISGCSNTADTGISHTQDLLNNSADSQCGRKVRDISVNVVKHHSVRKHTTEHNHSIVVERHNTDTNISQLSEPNRETDTNGSLKKGSQEFSGGLDSGYQTKQLPTKALFDSQTLVDLKSTSASQANTSADVEGNRSPHILYILSS